MKNDITALSGYAEMLEELHKNFTPHGKQLQAASDLFFGGVKRMFMCLGRRSGKSSLMCYMAVRWALTRPKSHIYIVGPLLQTQREIILSSGLLLDTIPRKYLKDYNRTEGRVNFTNESFIRILGADSPETLRGLRCSLICLDEAKDIKREVLDIITPTLIDEDAPMIIAGTPPEVAEHPFWDLVNEAKESPDWRYYHGTSYDNPHLKKEVIDRERLSYEKRGDGDVFLREFMAQYVPGGKRAVFPMVTEEHFLPFSILYNRIQRNPERWKYYCTMDPGSASCFAVGLFAVNPYNGLVYALNEVYEQLQAETSVGRIWPRVHQMMKEIYVPEFDEEPWHVTVDEAALAIRTELLDQFGVASFPTSKASNKKSAGISLMKDMFRDKKLILSDKMVSARKEILAYMLDANGFFVKKNDHQIDLFRYTLAACNYTYVESTPPHIKEAIPDDEKRRAFTVEEDFKEHFGIEDEMYMSDFD